MSIDQSQLSANLYTPAGASILEIRLNAETAPVYLPQSGNYMLVIDGESDAIGSFAFRLLDIATQPTVTTNTTNSITISPSSITVIRRLTGTAGQRVVLEPLSYTGTDAEWMLVDPANEVIAQGRVHHDLGTNLLSVSGTYLIVVSGTVQGGPSLSFQFRVRDVSETPVAASGFNTVRSGNIEPGQTNSFTFVAPAGTPAYYDALVQEDQSDIGFEIAAPDGEIIVSQNSGSIGWENATFDYGPVVLPRSGTYIIRVIGNSGGYYRFRLLNLWSNALSVTYGVTNSGSFGETNATVIYRLTASPGQRLFFNSLVGWRDVRLGLWRASASGIWDYFGLDSWDFLTTASSPEPLYFIFASRTGDPTTAYRFRIISLEQAPAVPVSLDTTVTNLLSEVRVVHVYRFNLVAGQKIFVDFECSNPNGWWQLFDPDGNETAWVHLNSDSVIERSASGTYALAVGPWVSDGPPNVGYSFRIVTMTASTNALVFGVGYSNSITAVGQEHYYTFNGAIGMRIYYDALQYGGSQVPVRLIAPNGDQVLANWNHDADTGPTTLNQNGIYVLVFGGRSDATGSYAFRLIDVSQPPASALSLNTIVTGTNDPYHAKVFRVPISAGKQLFCDSRLTTWSGSWSMFDANDGLLTGNSLAFDMEPTPTGTGTGLLIVSGSAEPCPYQFRVLEPTRTTNAIPIGTVVSNYLSDAGNEHYLTFNAVAGQRLYFDALDQSLGDVWVYMDSLDRLHWIWNGGKNQDAGLSTMPASGTYTLRVHNSSSSAVSYKFRILDLAAQPALTLGSPISAQLNPATQTHIYRIAATAGQKIHFQRISASSYEANWLIQDPFDNPIAWANIQTDLGTVLFAVSGTYALIIQGYGSESETLNYQIQATDLTEPTMPPAGFGFFSGYINPGQTNYLYFNASAGTPVYIDSLTNNFSITLRLLDTNGTVVLETAPGYGGAGVPDPGFCILPSSGTYTLEIAAYNGGDYAFRLMNLLTDAPLLTLGSNYSVTFTNAFQTDVYRINGTGAQMLLYDALKGSGDSVYLAMLKQNGAALVGGIRFSDWGSASANSDHGPVRLPDTGTYYLVIMNASDQTPEYKFRVLTTAVSARVNLSSNYTNSIPPFECVILHFTNPPAALFFDALAPNWWTRWDYIMAGSDQITAGGWSDFESRSLVSGTNFVILRNDTQDTQTWSFRILVPVHATNALVLGTVYSNSLTPGQEHLYTFAGTPGQKVYFDSLVAFHSGYWWVGAELYAPSGNQIWVGYYCNDSFPPLLLTESGTYRLCLHNYSDQIAPYTFRVLDVSAQPTISLDVTNSCIVNPGTAARLFRFYVTNQARLYLDSLITEWVNADWLIFNSANQLIGGNYIRGDIEVTWGNLSGELLLILNDYHTNQYTHTFRIIPGNHAPVFTSPNIATVAEQTTLSFTNTVYDPEAPNDQISFALAGAVPSGMTINQVTGVIAWTPSEAQGPSTNTFFVIATDDGVPPLSSSTTLTVIVNEVNRPPVLSVPTNQVINELTPMSVYASATDPDIPTNTLTFGLVSAPTGANINPNTGQITWTPTEAQGPSTNLFVVRVTDSNAWALVDKQLSATNSFTVIVNEVNSAPVLPVQTNRIINELALLVVTNTATDGDIPANTLSYQLLGPPAGATISTNGVITWTPTEAQGPGVYTITTVVTDNGTPPLSATNSFSVTVNEVNCPPVLNMPPNTNVNELATLLVTVSATDTDIPTNTLSFSLVSPPVGMSINTNSGLIAWTPTEAQGPSTNIITVVVSDLNTNALNAQQLHATNTFTVVVNEVNSPPVLTLPANQTVHAGTYISLNATASDPDIPPNALGFALLSGPTGLTVGTEGIITWQTTDAHAGTTNTVAIRVTDNGVPPLSSTNSFVITVLDRPFITSIKRSNELVTVTWTSIAGTVYRLQYKTNLTDPTWLAVPGDVPASGPTASKTDNVGTVQRRFYRVIVP